MSISVYEVNPLLVHSHILVCDIILYNYLEFHNIIKKFLLVQCFNNPKYDCKFFLQIAWEIKALDNKKYIMLSECLNEIGRMLGGWIKGLKSKTLPNNGREKR